MADALAQGKAHQWIYNVDFKVSARRGEEEEEKEEER